MYCGYLSVVGKIDGRNKVAEVSSGTPGQVLAKWVFLALDHNLESCDSLVQVCRPSGCNPNVAEFFEQACLSSMDITPLLK